ncbi:hypothetical protein BV898_06683 [Hypsibius exemplaris]|uniref:Mitotic-spindle organizing protein 1 n=1 Tax=Hypsibius exemplaris TaxID=2072580 RepID=A0A1W0WVM3_HYPEX|nr:hypothetical protein BV898_06683 [Hypsibius exemplaris]
MVPEKSSIPRSSSNQLNGTSKRSDVQKVNGSASTAIFGHSETSHTDPLKASKELSDMLRTGLTEEQLGLAIQLLQDGIPARMLADFVKRSRSNNRSS